MSMNRTIPVATLFLLLAGACGESNTEPEPDPEPEPVIDVDGFRILSGAPIFEWRQTDGAEADTLHLQWATPITARFVWLDANGDSIDVGANALLVVTTPDERFATWSPSTTPFVGTFSAGSFPEVETSFNVRLVIGNTIAVNAPDLVLRVSP